MKKENWGLIISILLIILAVLSPVVIYLRYSSYNDYTGLAALGPVGDFIGGTTVTFLTGASVILLIATNIMQHKELQMSRKSVDEMVNQSFCTTNESFSPTS